MTSTAGTNEIDDKDLDFAQAQAQALANHLEQQGHFLAAEMVLSMRRLCGHLVQQVEALELQVRAYRDEASGATLAINPCTKHRYGAGNVCTKCGAARQRNRSGKAGLLAGAAARGVREGVTDSATILEDGASS